MYYNPIDVITNNNNLCMNLIINNDYYAGANQNIPDNKSIFKIISGKGIFLKTSSQYKSIPYTISKKKNILLYNIYDLRDYIQDNPNYTINNFLDTLKSKTNRIMLLSGDTTYKIRNPNRQIFSNTSYPILITFTLNDGINIVIEDPVDKIEKYTIPNNLCYVYKQKNTYVLSVDSSNVTPNDIYYISSNKNNITSTKLSKWDVPLTKENESFEKIQVTKLVDYINQIIKPTTFNFSDYYEKYVNNK